MECTTGTCSRGNKKKVREGSRGDEREKKREGRKREGGGEIGEEDGGEIGSIRKEREREIERRRGQ